MDESFEEIMTLLERVKQLHPKMKEGQQVELTKLITYNQLWLDLTVMIDNEVIH